MKANGYHLAAAHLATIVLGAEGVTVHDSRHDDAAGNVGRDLIVGGGVLPEGSSEYLVSIEGDRVDYRLCGGTLISPRVVLTAAHCFTCDRVDVDLNQFGCTNSTNGSLRDGTSSVMIGRRDRSDTTSGVEVPICDPPNCSADQAQLIPFPNFTVTDKGDDVALIYLPADQEVTNIDPIELNCDAQVPSESAALDVIGWGTESFELPTNGTINLPFTNVAKTIELDYIANNNCMAPETGWSNGLILNSMLCAGDTSGTRSACFGDSGGPAIDAAGKQVGVISFVGARGQDGCNIGDLPNVFARVSTQCPWMCTTTAGPDIPFCVVNTTTTTTTTTSTTTSTATSTATSTSTTTTDGPTPKPTPEPTPSPSAKPITSPSHPPTWPAPKWPAPTGKSKSGKAGKSGGKAGKSGDKAGKSGRSDGHHGQWPGQWHETEDGHNNSGKSGTADNYKWNGQWHGK